MSFGPWVTPAPRQAAKSLLSRILRSQGEDGTNYPFVDADWALVLGEAYDGLITNRTAFSLPGYLGESRDANSVAVQAQEYRYAFTYPPFSPPLPAGATGVEYEDPAGVPTEYPTFTGTYRLSITTPHSDYQESVSVRSSYETPYATTAWYGPTAAGALPEIGTMPWLPLSGFTIQTAPFSFTDTTASPDVSQFLIVLGQILVRRDVIRGGGGNVNFPSGPNVSRLYQPPRYRYIFGGRTPIRGRQRASGVMGTVPLRGRQGDKWGLRGRQNSNL